MRSGPRSTPPRGCSTTAAASHTPVRAHAQVTRALQQVSALSPDPWRKVLRRPPLSARLEHDDDYGDDDDGDTV